MIGKVYFVLASLLLLFSIYYELIVNGFSLDIFKIFMMVVNILVILGGYSYYLKKKVFEQKVWQKIYFVLLANLGLNILLQFMPKLLKGDLSIYYFNIGANITGFIVGSLFFVPLYIAVYRLAHAKAKKKK